MHRIAAALLITLSVLAFNGGTLRQAFAGEPMLRPPAPSAQMLQPAAARGSKLLSLLVILEALRQAPGSLDSQKV